MAQFSIGGLNVSRGEARSAFNLGLKVEVKGVDELIAFVGAIPQLEREGLELVVTQEGIALRDRARAKASGEVLQEITGRLEQSIQFEMKSNASGVRGYVYSEDPAEPLLEYGGVESARDILPSVRSVMAFVGSPLLHILSLGTAGMVFAKVVHRPDVTYPEHSVIHSTFEEMADEIRRAVESPPVVIDLHGQRFVHVGFD